MPTESGSPSPGRLVSLDAFRGATIVAMILVNNPGTWSAVYPPLLHAEWHGWTMTDLIFPFFLFIVGVAIVFAYTKRLAAGADRKPLVRKAGKRTLVLFGLGLFLAAFPFVTFEPSFGLRQNAFETIRILGVLQRIALCYFAATLLFLYTTRRTRRIVLVAILLGYWAALTLVPVPGYGAGRIDEPEATFAAWVDRAVLGEDHLWVGAGRRWDPEGLLSTLPALATTLLGLWAGRILIRDDRSGEEKTARLMVAGVTLATIGAVWGWFFPINKGIWTSSYVLLTGGLAFCALGFCYWHADVRGHRRWTRPFTIYGVNAITVFVASGVVGRILYLVRVPGPEGEPIALQAWIFQHVFLPLAAPVNASLLYALTWIGGWFLVLLWMARRGIVIKV